MIMEMVAMKLPRPIEGQPSILELKKPNSETLGKAAEEGRKKRVNSGIKILLRGGIESIDGNSPDASLIGKMPICSCEVATIEILKQLDVPTMMEGFYKCPRCNTALICELTDEADTRDDVSDVQIDYWEGTEYSDGFFRHTLRDPIKVYGYEKSHGKAKETVLLEVISMTFRDVLLDDMTWLENQTDISGEFSAQKHLMLRCLIDIEAKVEDERDANLERIKKRYPQELVIFPDPRDMFDILEGMRRYGLKPFKRRICKVCEKKWDAAIDYSSFFESALLYKL